MKYLVVTLLLCGLVATGFSAQADEQLKPIGGFLNPPHPVILNLAKETLKKVQDNLRSAGRLEESLHLNKLVDQTDKILEKSQKGVIRTEQFDLDDHLDSIYNALEKYKNLLPVDTKASINVFADADDEGKGLSDKEAAIYQLEELEKSLETVLEGLQRDRKFFETGRVKLFLYILRQAISNTNDDNANRRSIGLLLTRGREILRKHNQYLQQQDVQLAVASVDGEEETNDYDNEDKKEEEMSRLQKLRKRLVDLRERLHKRNRRLVVKVVDSYLLALDNIIDRLKNNHLRTEVAKDFVSRVTSLLERFSDLIKDNRPSEEFIAFASSDDEGNQPDEKEKEEYLTTLQRLRKRLEDLRDRLHERRRNLVAAVVEANIKALDSIVNRLKNNHLRTEVAKDFVSRVTNLLERFSDVLKERVN